MPAAAVLAVSLAVATALAQAQEAGTTQVPAGGPVSAAASGLSGSYEFNIPRQPLGAALAEWSRQCGLQVLRRDAVNNGEEPTSPPLAGRFSPAEALDRLLANSGLTYEFVNERTVRIAPVPAAPSGGGLRQTSMVLAAAAPSAPADAPASQPVSEELDFEITVTASRISRSGYTAPTPTTVVGADDIAQRGATNVSEVLNELPSFRASTGPQTNGVLTRTPGATYADLRGLGSSRTLVLVDGKRFVPQIAHALAGYQVDLRQVPALMVERSEVVTGGASAQWGSDAVTGVVNIVLKKDFQGLQTEAQYGQSARGDNESKRIAVIGGTSLLDGRAHITAAVDYEQNDGVGDVYTRDWGRRGYSLVANPTPGATPTQLILPDVQFSRYTPGGLINNTILRGTQFVQGGVPMQFEYGDYVGTLNMVGGGQPGINIGRGPSISPGIERRVAYTRGSFEFSDAVTAYAEASWSRSNGGGRSLPARDTAIVINQDNAFLPDSIRQVMIDNAIPSFQMGRISYDVSWVTSDVTNETMRVVGGLEGQLSMPGDWTWNTHYSYGRNENQQYVFDNRIHSNFRLAYDAVFEPGTGRIVCRSTLTDPGNGCVPMNLFGEGSPSQAAIDYVTGTTDGNTRYTQHAAAANLSGSPLRTWAGPVSVATGLEWRAEEQRTVVDPIAAASGYESSNAQPLSGKFNVKEVYLETVVPLAGNRRGIDSLELNGAIRHADYSTRAGGQTTWKIGATYTPFDGLMFRAVRSRDIRAPNIYEMYVGPTRLTGNISYPPFQPQVVTVNSGNPDLQPEVAETTTLGFTWRPSFARNWQLALDYYDIGVTDQIATLSSQVVANLCLRGDQAYCNLITFDGPVPSEVRLPYLNLARVDIEGIDLQASWRTTPGRLPGALQVNLSGNYLLGREVDNGTGASVLHQAGEVVNPRFSATTALTYSLGRGSVSTQIRYAAPTKYDNTFTTGVQISDNDVPSVTYVNLSGSFQATDKLELFGVVNNLFDKDPVMLPQAQGYPTNSVVFDMIGTTYRVGVRYRH